MFEMLILLVVVILAWWMITSLSLVVSRGLRRVRLESQKPAPVEVRETSR